MTPIKLVWNFSHCCPSAELCGASVCGAFSSVASLEWSLPDSSGTKAKPIPNAMRKAIIGRENAHREVYWFIFHPSLPSNYFVEKRTSK